MLVAQKLKPKASSKVSYSIAWYNYWWIQSVCQHCNVNVLNGKYCCVGVNSINAFIIWWLYNLYYTTRNKLTACSYLQTASFGRNYNLELGTYLIQSMVSGVIIFLWCVFRSTYIFTTSVASCYCRQHFHINA